MAITYPRELFSYSLSEGALELADNVAMSPSGNGTFINLSRVNDPVWLYRLTSGLIYPADVAAWSAWAKSLQGGLKTFLAYDVRRRAPLAYPDAEGPSDIAAGWSGLATATALGLGGALALSGLPAYYTLSAGDRIGLEQGGRYGYYEIIETVTATSGGVATVTVIPFLHTVYFTTSAVVRVWRPKAKLVLNWSSWREPTTQEPQQISFTAFQRI